MRHVFAKLGGGVDRQWQRAGRDLSRLPALAAAALRELDLRALDPVQIAVRCAMDRRLPPQLATTFGDAQVTVWSGRHLLVQLVYWLDSTTAIHQHGFAGAFRVLCGASMHSTYTFAERPSVAGRGPGPAGSAAERRRGSIDATFRIGTLAPRRQELLEAGDVREIGPGPALIHNLIHLVFPSATLVLRTPFLRELDPQWTYHAPGIALDPLVDQPELRARIRLLEVCSRIDSRDARRIAEAIVEQGLPASWALLNSVAEQATDRELAPFLRMVRRRHGADGRIVAEGFERQRVRLRLFQLRLHTKSRPHRTLLALLADGSDGSAILDSIRRLYPGRPPTERIERWLLELAAPLGLTLDRDGARVLRRAIEGRDAAAIARECGYSMQVVTALVAAFRRFPLFAPLFAQAKPSST